MILVLFILGLIVFFIEAMSKIALPLFIIVIASVLLVWVSAYEDSQNKKKFAQIDMAYVDSMSGLDFEQYVAQLLKNNGYNNVSVTQASGDYGVDILAKKEGKTYAFQCKRYTSNLGVKAIQEIYSGAKMYQSDIPVVITNSFFTPNAKQLASRLGVQLWDRNKLNGLMKTALCAQNPTPAISSQKTQTPTTQTGKISSHLNSGTEKLTIKHPIGLFKYDDIKGPIQKNQIPNGQYIIGKDIPAGVYDFKALHGSGIMKKYLSESCDKYNYFERIGIKDYDNQNLINVNCKEGEVLEVPDNVVVAISRSNKVVLDL